MIRISEIRELVKRHPAPAMRGEMRDAISNTFDKLEFVEEGHHYYLPRENGDKEEVISVSNLISQFEQPTDWDQVSLGYAEKRGLDVEDVRRSWKETNVTALSRGSKTHFFGEMLMRLILGDEDGVRQQLPFQITDDYIIPYCSKEEAILQYWTDLLCTGKVWSIMPETKVYTGLNDKCDFLFNYAGTFDILLAMQIGQEVKVALHDYKTNALLTNEFCQSYGKMMLPPFDDMFDEALSHYNVQLSAYQIPLESIGMEVADRRIIWLKDDGTYEKIKVPDMTERIRMTLTDSAHADRLRNNFLNQ